MAEFAALIPTVGMIRALCLEIAPAEPLGPGLQHLDRMLLLGRADALLHGIGSLPALAIVVPCDTAKIARGILALHSKLCAR